MNEMYNMGILTHNWSVISVLGVILINIFMLLGIKNLAKYKRAVLLFTPIVGTAIGMAIFTGVVMMAAKHLDFTIQNIAMIILSISLIVLEAKRSKRLKFLNKNNEETFFLYKTFALKIFALEMGLVLIISFWMWA